MNENALPYFVSPRRTAAQAYQQRKPKVALTALTLRSLFHLRQPDAARVLGISLTALKNACKRLRVGKWPYTRVMPGDEDGADRASSPDGSVLAGSPPTSEDADEQEEEGATGWLGGRVGWTTEALLEEAMTHASR